MRVLLSTYSADGSSSYGTITRELWKRLIKSGELEVAQHAWFHAPVMEPAPWPIQPTNRTMLDANTMGFDPKDYYGEASFESVVKAFRPDIVWNLSDVYMSKYLERFKKKYGYRLIRWTLSAGDPVDLSDIPFIEEADACVAITDYSARVWGEITGNKYPVIYHGVDSDVFKPATPEEKQKLRKANTLGMSGKDDFMILYVGRNQGRKRPWLTFEILHYLRTGAWGWDRDGMPVRMPWDPVAKKHMPPPRTICLKAKPVKAFLWLHSHDDGQNYNYRRLISQWDLGDAVRMTAGLSDSAALEPQQLANIYKMADVVSMVSGSEGFGVPTIEATACGIPTVYTDYAGGGEIGKVCGGLAVSWDGWEPAKGSCVRWVYPNVDSALDRFYTVWAHQDEYEKAKTNLRRIAVNKFNWDKIAVQWMDILREIGSRPVRRTLGDKV